MEYLWIRKIPIVHKRNRIWFETFRIFPEGKRIWRANIVINNAKLEGKGQINPRADPLLFSIDIINVTINAKYELFVVVLINR